MKDTITIDNHLYNDLVEDSQLLFEILQMIRKRRRTRQVELSKFASTRISGIGRCQVCGTRLPFAYLRGHGECEKCASDAVASYYRLLECCKGEDDNVIPQKSAYIKDYLERAQRNLKHEEETEGEADKS